LVGARPRVEAERLVVELLAGHLGEPRHERRGRPSLEPCLDRPVLLRREGADLPLALADDAHGHRLHAARRQPAAHLLPEERRELVADQAVEDAARLLGLEAVLVERPRVLDRLEHGLLGDLVEEHAVDVLPSRPELLGDVPGDRLALAGGVRREVDVLLVLGGALDLLEDLRLALDDVVLGLEVAVEVDAELRLRKVHHVADRGLHLVVAPEVLAERLRLGGGLDDDQVLRHGGQVRRAQAACRRKRLPGSWQTRPRSSSARSVSSAWGAGSPARRIRSSTCSPSAPTPARTRRSSALSVASAAAARVAARRAASPGPSWARMSSTPVTSVAPSWISRCGPRVPGPSGPGTANPSRPPAGRERPAVRRGVDAGGETAHHRDAGTRELAPELLGHPPPVLARAPRADHGDRQVVLGDERAAHGEDDGRVGDLAKPRWIGLVRPGHERGTHGGEPRGLE